MPALPDGKRWHAAVTEWWADLWASPMAGEYHSSDIHQLHVLARLYQDFYDCDDSRSRLSCAAEIRLQRQQFGLTPYDRRRLEWQIEVTDEAQARGRQRRAPRAVPGADPRASVLRAKE
jgi:hypothetical protein